MPAAKPSDSMEPRRRKVSRCKTYLYYNPRCQYWRSGSHRLRPWEYRAVKIRNRKISIDLKSIQQGSGAMSPGKALSVARKTGGVCVFRNNHLNFFIRIKTIKTRTKHWLYDTLYSRWKIPVKSPSKEFMNTKWCKLRTLSI